MAEGGGLPRQTRQYHIIYWQAGEHGLGDGAEEGHAAEVLTRVAADTGAELLVLGTHARDGVQGLLLGNTAERVLHVIDTDVVTVHAP